MKPLGAAKVAQQIESSVRQYLILDPYEQFPLMTLDDDWVVIATHIEEPQVQVKAIDPRN